MTDEEIARLIHEEFARKALGATEQYLEIHEPVYENGLPKITRIDREKKDGSIIAYLPVKDEYFSFAVYIDEKGKSIGSLSTESRNIVSFLITSNLLTADKLLLLTTLKPTKKWNKGDQMPNKRSSFKNNGLEFEPNPEPDEFEDKLKKLLNYLETDRDGVLSLISNAEGYIRVIMDFHQGNQLIGGISIDSECIKIMSELNLQISVDITAWGNPFR
jgi:hypothetical protein